MIRELKVLDSRGRLFGKISILDLGAALVIVMVIVGIFLVPGPSGSVAQISGDGPKPVKVDVLVRGLNVGNFDQFSQDITQSPAKIIIRNQPAGEIQIKSFQELPRTTPVSQPDGSVKALPDPRPEVAFIKDMIITLEGKAQLTDDGIVLGNQKVKIGTVIELDGPTYNFNSSVMDVSFEK